jgi:magnesium transporter
MAESEPGMAETAANRMPFELDIAVRRKGSDRFERVSKTSDIGEASLAWVHVLAHDPAAAATFLSAEFGFHELQIEDALTPGERPHLHENGAQLFFTAPSIYVSGERVYFAEVGFFLTAGRLVTVASEPVKMVKEQKDRICSRAEREVRDVSELTYRIIDQIVDDYYPAMDMLEDRADQMESDVFGGRVVPIKDLLRVKRRLLEIRRRLSPFRDILNGLLRHDLPIIKARDRTYYQDVYDHVLRVLEHVDLSRDILASILDANLATVSNRLNQIMRIMTVISTVLMSVAVVSGIYGMNFRFMPETQWPWGYPAAIVLMAGIALFELWLFKKKGWL